ncbi:hypothetical protein B9Z55_026455 [Caenorhabditis nigoni]|uniref:Uncharacterized protein n=1 Tax=Caenorhabditis nigoni TaxID=1611254 RepID=A0A2G5T3D8_9PELO|nr:hypothetical protein B9Z55_026455 [Caenorhabditis nigoni]
MISPQAVNEFKRRHAGTRLDVLYVSIKNNPADLQIFKEMTKHMNITATIDLDNALKISLKSSGDGRGKQANFEYKTKRSIGIVARRCYYWVNDWDIRTEFVDGVGYTFETCDSQLTKLAFEKHIGSIIDSFSLKKVEIKAKEGMYGPLKALGSALRNSGSIIERFDCEGNHITFEMMESIMKNASSRNVLNNIFLPKLTPTEIRTLVHCWAMGSRVDAFTCEISSRTTIRGIVGAHVESKIDRNIVIIVSADQSRARVSLVNGAVTLEKL